MQNSLVLMIDSKGALADNRLDGNIYLVDNTGPFRLGEETSLTSTLKGVHSPSGSMVLEQVLNWVSYDIAGLPPTVPRSFFRQDYEKAQLRHLVTQMRQAKKPEEMTQLVDRQAQPDTFRTTIAPQDDESQGYTLDIPPLGPTGALLTSAEAIMASSYIPPLITAISGPAVEEGVIFPAQYGSPDLVDEGWYWSASVDTSKVGQHSYHLHILIYRPVQRDDGQVVWQPVPFVAEAHLNISTAPQTNGFTGCAPGVLPLVPVYPHPSAPSQEDQQ